MSEPKKKKKITFADFKRQIAQAQNKDKLWAGVCFAIAIGLIVWFIFFHLL